MAGVIGFCACSAPAPSVTSTASGEPPAGTTQATATDGSTATTWAQPPTNTFGVDGPGDGSEVGFVGPLDVACAGAPGGSSAHCSLCSVREQSCVDDFKCVAWAEDDGDAWNGTKCIGTSLQEAQVGEPCVADGSPVSGRDDCVVGAMCWDVDPQTLEGVCVPFCGPKDAGSRACPPQTACMLDGLDVLALCLSPCDPLDGASCPADATCRWFPQSAAAFCIPDQGGVVLSSTIQCGSEDIACAADRVCVSAATYGGCGAPSCCTAWCDHSLPEADAQCAALEPGHVCVPLFDRGGAPAAYENLGICATPGD